MLIMISMSAVLQTAPQPAPADLGALVRSTRACMSAAVIRLEPSGEAAPVVADAARTTCDSERQAVENFARSRGSTPEAGETIATRVMAELDVQIREQAVLQVTEIRAARHR